MWPEVRMLCAACGEATEARPCSACGAEPLLDGRYALLEIRGHGGIGTTYRARDEGGRIVAIKELPVRIGATDKQIQLFQREARVLQQLSHPRIPAYVEDFQAGAGKQRALYLVQAFVEGTDLERELAERRTSWREVLDLMAELLEVLAYLHERSPPVIHRDLKPRNLIRESSSGQVFLVDFGSVRDALQDDLGGSTVAGTFGFMAPEQFMGSASPATDLYGLGATAVALLTRRPLNTLLDTNRRLDWEPHVQLPAPVVALLRDLLCPDPDERPSSPQQVSARIEAILDGAEPTALVPRAVELPAARSEPVTALSMVRGGPAELELDRVVRGVLKPGHEALATATIEQALRTHAGRVERLPGLYRWATAAEVNRMVRVSLTDLGDGTTRIHLWERMSGRAGSLYGGILGGFGGGLGGGFAWAFLPLGPLAVAAWVGAVTIGAYLLARTLFARTARARRTDLERAMDELARFLETG